MNRFTIDEDQQYEINGVFTLSIVFDYNAKIYPYHDLQNAVNLYQSDTKRQIHTHCLIGTSKYGKYFYSNTAVEKHSNIRKMIVTWAQKHFPSIWISYTILDGRRHKLYENTDVQYSYRTNNIELPRPSVLETLMGQSRQELFGAEKFIVERRYEPNVWLKPYSPMPLIPSISYSRPNEDDLRKFIKSHGSLNDDLEDFYEKNCKFKSEIISMEDSHEKESFGKVLFLYEYEFQGSEKEKYSTMKYQIVGIDEFLLSICTRFTVTLKSPLNFLE